MAKNKWMDKLSRLEGAVNEQYDVFANVIRTPSPSVNFIFGKSHGLPLGFTMCLFGPPKGGKTVLCNSIIGQLHRDDPDAIAVKYDTEMRERGQLTPQQAALWGIDMDRYKPYLTNNPITIFDGIEHDLAAMCQEGMPLKLVIIDSITQIQGRRAQNADTIETQQIGDLALTLQDGFKRILPIQRKYNFSMIINAHVRAEMDPQEQRRGVKVKMAASWGVKHYAEYFVYVAPNLSKEGRQDISGNDFVDKSVKDLQDKNEQTAHKIRVKVVDSSMGPVGRTGEFTLHRTRGIVNTHEEIFLLGKNRNIFERPNARTYSFGGQTWNGAPATLEAIKNDPELARAILDELRRRDLSGEYIADETGEFDTSTIHNEE